MSWIAALRDELNFYRFRNRGPGRDGEQDRYRGLDQRRIPTYGPADWLRIEVGEADWGRICLIRRVGRAVADGGGGIGP